MSPVRDHPVRNLATRELRKGGGKTPWKEALERGYRDGARGMGELEPGSEGEGLHVRLWDTGLGGREKVWMRHPWHCWMGLGASWSGGRCPRSCLHPNAFQACIQREAALPLPTAASRWPQLLPELRIPGCSQPASGPASLHASIPMEAGRCPWDPSAAIASIGSAFPAGCQRGAGKREERNCCCCSPHPIGIPPGSSVKQLLCLPFISLSLGKLGKAPPPPLQV